MAMLGGAALRPALDPADDLHYVASFLKARCGGLQAAFAALDEFNSGQLTRGSFAHGMGRLGFKEDTTFIFRALDTDNSGTVTMKQFMTALTKGVFEDDGLREGVKANDTNSTETAERALELATKANQMCIKLEQKLSKHMSETFRLQEEVQAKLVREEAHTKRAEGFSQSGLKVSNVSVVSTSDIATDIQKEIAAIRQAMSTRASATDQQMSELTQVTREIASELAILRGRLQAIGDRPDLAAQIVARGTWQTKDDRPGRESPQTPRSTDSDISALRPRSVSAERSLSTCRQFTVEATRMLRSAEGYPGSGGQRAKDTLTCSGSSDAEAYQAGSRADDPLLQPRHGLATVLDVIAEARPSLERPSTQATSGRPSMEILG